MADGRLPSAEAAVGVWRKRNGCGTKTTRVYRNGSAVCLGFTGCAKGAPVILCTIAGAGHTWPGGRPYRMPGADIGAVSYDIDANDILYAADSESNTRRNPGWRRGIYIGSVRDGWVTAFVPDPEPEPDNSSTSAAEARRSEAITGAPISFLTP